MGRLGGNRLILMGLEVDISHVRLSWLVLKKDKKIYKLNDIDTI